MMIVVNYSQEGIPGHPVTFNSPGRPEISVQFQGTIAEDLSLSDVPIAQPEANAGGASASLFAGTDCFPKRPVPEVRYRPAH